MTQTRTHDTSWKNISHTSQKLFPSQRIMWLFSRKLFHWNQGVSSFGRKWLYCNLQKYKHVQPKVTFKHQHIEHEETTTPSPTLIQPMKKITYRQYNTHPSIHNLLIYNTDRLLKLLKPALFSSHQILWIFVEKAVFFAQQYCNNMPLSCNNMPQEASFHSQNSVHLSRKRCFLRHIITRLLLK